MKESTIILLVTLAVVGLSFVSRLDSPSPFSQYHSLKKKGEKIEKLSLDIKRLESCKEEKKKECLVESEGLERIRQRLVLEYNLGMEETEFRFAHLETLPEGCTQVLKGGY